MKATSQEIKDFFFKETRRQQDNILDDNTLSFSEKDKQYLYTENTIKGVEQSFLEYFFKRKV